jgi:hypothetical protein
MGYNPQSTIHSQVSSDPHNHPSIHPSIHPIIRLPQTKQNSAAAAAQKGPVIAPVPIDEEEEARRRARAARFGLPDPKAEVRRKRRRRRRRRRKRRRRRRLLVVVVDCYACVGRCRVGLVGLFVVGRIGCVSCVCCLCGRVDKWRAVSSSIPFFLEPSQAARNSQTPASNIPPSPFPITSVLLWPLHAPCNDEQEEKRLARAKRFADPALLEEEAKCVCVASSLFFSSLGAVCVCVWGHCVWAKGRVGRARIVTLKEAAGAHPMQSVVKCLTIIHHSSLSLSSSSSSSTNAYGTGGKRGWRASGRPRRSERSKWDGEGKVGRKETDRTGGRTPCLSVWVCTELQ